MKKLLLLIFIVSTFIVDSQAQNEADKSFVVFLVRHAEKVDNSRDPKLSEAGKQRAVELAETLKSAEIDFIHSTNFVRTRATVLPFAETLNKEVLIYDYANLENFAKSIKKKGGRHLVVGHSNTTPSLVKLLGGDAGAPIVEKNEYDRLYVLSFNENGSVSTVLLRYGKKFENE